MDATQIILIVFIVLLIIIYPIMISTRNKKENQRMQEQTNSLKRGDKVLTTSGVYGTIVDLQMEGDKKIVTIETGTDKKKGYISVDAYAIYTIFKDEEQKVEDKTLIENKTEQDLSKKEEDKVEVKIEEEKKNEIESKTEENNDKNQNQLDLNSDFEKMKKKEEKKKKSK